MKLGRLPDTFQITIGEITKDASAVNNLLQITIISVEKRNGICLNFQHKNKHCYAYFKISISVRD